jgi:hypothetical protein
MTAKKKKTAETTKAQVPRVETDAFLRAAGAVESAVTATAAARAALVEADRKWAAAAGRLNGAQWRERVETVVDPIVRAHVACIIWWDYFGGRIAAERWADLDDYKADYKETDNADMKAVAAALVALGFPAERAQARIAGIEP